MKAPVFLRAAKDQKFLECPDFLSAAKDLILLLCIACTLTPLAFSIEKEEGKLGGITLKKVADEESAFNLYGLAELRHQQNTYYDDDNYRSSQIPSWHARLRLGAVLRGGLIDLYGTVGVIKETETQQLLQKRPEIELDIYPWVWSFGQIVQYNLVKLPFADETKPQKSAQDAEDEAIDNHTVAKQGSIFVIGLAPTLVLPAPTTWGEFKFKAGLDYWTELYSRRQKREDLPDSERDRHYALDKDRDTGNEDTQDSNAEDTAMRLYTEYMVATGYAPSFLPSSLIDVGVFYDSYFVPKYSDAADDAADDEAQENADYKYIAIRESHYRLRFQYEFNDRVVFANDFYHFHDGLFAGRKKGDDRRFRNIAQISYRL